jgi:septum formation protein
MYPTKLILASGSPRRKALLEAAGLRFDIIQSGVDETHRCAETARSYALRMAREKATSVSMRFPDALVLAADTVVDCDGRVLVKPSDINEARQMLATLSGRGHIVITAYAIAHNGVISEAAAVVSEVNFRPLATAEIDDYVASGEPLDKAGAYGIQGRGADFITTVAGSRNNVMGLPLDEVLSSLAWWGFVRKP